MKRLFNLGIILTVLLSILTMQCYAENLRENPNFEANIIDNLPEEAEVKVLSMDGHWYYIFYNGNYGYLYNPYAETVKLTGTVSAQIALIRQSPDDESEIIGVLAENEVVVIEEITDDWYKLEDGYIRRDFLQLEENDNDTAEQEIITIVEEDFVPIEELIDPNINIIITPKIVSITKKYLGVPYIWGGTTPTGFDCSGFTQYVMRQCGYSINRTAANQYSNGTYVAYSDLQAGDLVFFSSGGKINHVGIYIGDGQFIHSPHTGDVVKISSLSETYYTNHYYGARRVS